MRGKEIGKYVDAYKSTDSKIILYWIKNAG